MTTAEAAKLLGISEDEVKATAAELKAVGDKVTTTVRRPVRNEKGELVWSD